MLNRMLEALREPLLPAQKLRILRVKIVTIPERCKGCDFCIEMCPKDVLDHSPELNAHGVHPPVVRSEDACVGCGICEQVCPDFALFMKKEEDP